MLLHKKKNTVTEYENITVALAGNPNVGKSTIFNTLTSSKQHTGNWPGKTVDTAIGTFYHGGKKITVADIPGTYSLIPHSFEEEIAADYIISGKCDKTVIVCDATCLEQSICLALQIAEAEISPILCINFIKEAEKSGTHINTELLQEILGFPVICVNAVTKEGIPELKNTLVNEFTVNPVKINYSDKIENALQKLLPVTEKYFTDNNLPVKYCNLRLLEGIKATTAPQIFADIAKAICLDDGIDVLSEISGAAVKKAEEICKAVVTVKKTAPSKTEKADKIIIGKYTAFPIMFLLLAVIFFITLKLASYPTDFLSYIFNKFENILIGFAYKINCPEIVYKPIIFGIYRVTAFVTAVMLPPMAIFFPFFTLLEDVGFLPRIAFNLDKAFIKCNACGKQSLTMCMGFGCNAVGVTGCRIIDSERERLVAILTNSLVPCNGRFPALITVISVFLTYNCKHKNILSALTLAAFVVLSIIITLFASKLLSITVLKGSTSAFTLELPSYRKPQILSTVFRSLVDRTVFVLLRAVSVAAPTGLILYLLCNIKIGNMCIIGYLQAFLNPVGKIFGVDGGILLSFILGFPANEIVLPILTMIYSGGGVISEIASTDALRTLLISNGWTLLTALNTVLLFLMHFPCSTTLITVKKETGSIKMTLIAFLLPVILGLLSCLITTGVSQIINYFA